MHIVGYVYSYVYYTSDTVYFTLIFSHAHAYTQICLELIKECAFNKVYEIGKRWNSILKWDHFNRLMILILVWQANSVLTSMAEEAGMVEIELLQ